MGRERHEARSGRQLEPRLRRLSYEDRRRVYRRRRIGAALVVAVILIALAAWAGAIPFLSGNADSGTTEMARNVDLSNSASRTVDSETEPLRPIESTAGEVTGDTEPEEPEAGKTAGESPEEKPAKYPQEDAGEPLDVLVLGVDQRPEESFVEGSRADTLMVARVFPRTGEVRLLSIPRDLFVEIEPGVQDRINAAYSLGGVRQTASAVERATGLSIDHYAVVDFKGFEKTVNTVGGVRVEIMDKMPPGRKMEGVETLNGRQALFYARYRGTAGGDLDRIERQQQIVAALRGKLLSWGTVPKLPELLETLRTNVETDLGVKENLSLARLLFQGEDARMSAAQLKGVPATLPDGRQVLLPQQEDNEVLLRDFRG